jgi:hypothetical protein
MGHSRLVWALHFEERHEVPSRAYLEGKFMQDYVRKGNGIARTDFATESCHAMNVTIFVQRAVENSMLVLFVKRAVIFRVMIPCSLLGCYQVGGTYRLHLHACWMSPDPRRPHSTISLPGKPPISDNFTVFSCLIDDSSSNPLVPL